MAKRANSQLAYKAQSGFGSLPSATGYQLLPLSTWDPSVSPNRVQDDTARSSRFSLPGRAGTINVTPRLEANMRTVAFDDFLSNLAQNAWSTDTLTQASTLAYLSLEDRQSDAGSGAYIVYQDVLVNSLTLRLGLNAMVRATWQFVGTQVAGSGTPTASTVAAATDPPFDTFNGSLTYDAGALSVTSLELTINNNLEPGFSLYSRYPDRIIGNLDQVSGQMTVAYDGVARFNEMLADSNHALVFAMTYGTKGHTWTLPAIRITGFGAPVDTGAERLQTLQFEADTSGGTKYTLVRDNT